MKNLVIIGAGGFAREVYDMAIYCYGGDENFSVKGFLSDNESNIESLGYPPILGRVKEYEIQPNDVFFCGIGSVKKINWDLKKWNQKSIDARFDLYFELLKNDLTTY